MDTTITQLHFGPNGLWLKLAIGLVVALGVAHSLLGERYILRRLFRREDLPALFGSAEIDKGPATNPTRARQ